VLIGVNRGMIKIQINKKNTREDIQTSQHTNSKDFDCESARNNTKAGKDMIDLREQISIGGASRHETFTPRYGWLKKGYDAAVVDGKSFNAPDAIERLGVGKNMVRSIRSWCLAFHLLETTKSIGQKEQKGSLQPTKLGSSLLSDDGWDPFLEDLGSLWLLHWQLFTPPYEAVSWPLVFNHCTLQTFDHKQLTKVLVSASKHYEKLSALSESSFDKDSSCLIRMYTGNKVEVSAGIESPFAQLDIIRPAGEQNTFRFITAEKQTLPSLIFAASCFQYAEFTQPNLESLSLHKIVYDNYSPGIAFKLNETEAGRLLDDASQKLGIDFKEDQGNRQLYYGKRPIELYWDALGSYYQRKTSWGNTI